MKKGITVILLTWKRPKNMEKIINAFTKQTIKPKLFLWNNNPDIKFEDDRVEWIVNSNEDMYSFARWLMIPMVETEYVMVMDDDLMPNDNKFIETAIRLIEKNPKGITGPFGKCIMKGSNPYNGPEVRTGPADIIKGRCMCMRTEVLKNVPLGTEGFVRNDDIYISFYAANGQKDRHYVWWKLREMTEDLPEGGVGMDKDPNHMKSRNGYINELINKEGRLK